MWNARLVPAKNLQPKASLCNFMGYKEVGTATTR